MKNSIRIELSADLLKEAKAYAKKHHSSLQTILENHLISLVAFDKASTQRNPIGFVKPGRGKSYGELLEERIKKKKDEG